jgi:hypothetical protein
VVIPVTFGGLTRLTKFDADWESHIVTPPREICRHMGKYNGISNMTQYLQRFMNAQVCYTHVFFLCVYIMYVCVCVCIYIYIYIYMHTYISASWQGCMYVCMYLAFSRTPFTSTHTYTHTYIHTHIHTHQGTWSRCLVLNWTTYIHTNIHTYTNRRSLIWVCPALNWTTYTHTYIHYIHTLQT